MGEIPLCSLLLFTQQSLENDSGVTVRFSLLPLKLRFRVMGAFLCNVSVLPMGVLHHLLPLFIFIGENSDFITE
jgi:hypothetical protein